MNINPQTLWQDLQTIRQTVPLIHNITNYVVMNNTANALLALGAAPVMAQAANEVEDMVQLAAALVINIGTLSDDWIAAMQLAMRRARQLNKPIAFDPVGAGATPYRTQATLSLLSAAAPTVIRGNASEIEALVTAGTMTKGVEATQSSEDAIAAAQFLASTYNCTTVISGAQDFIVAPEQILQGSNGHPLMAKVTGMGCTATALIGAFLAVNSDAGTAAAHAMTVMGIAGELAAAKAAGPGSLQLYFLDALYNLEKTDIESNFKLTQVG